MRKLLRSKKAQDIEEGTFVDEWALVIVLMIILPAIGLVFAMFVTGYQVQENSILGDSENVIAQSRFLNSPECFAYQDSVTSRAYPGIIDLSKFNQQRMDSCYDVPDDYISGCFRLELKNLDTNQGIGSVESNNYGSCIIKYSIKKEPYYVLIRSGNMLHAGIMFIESKIGQ